MRSRIIVFALTLMVLCFVVAQEKGKVLMIVNEAQSEDLEFMLTKEVAVMKDLLQKSGFEVVVSTGSNKVLEAGEASLKPDLKLSDVNISEYKGLIMPCMATNNTLPPEAFEIIKEAVAMGIPLAAQTGAVMNLGRSGVLKGKKYGAPKGWPAFEGAIYSGEEIIQDGTIITSAICPYMAKDREQPDGTIKLTEALIAELMK